MVFDVIGLILHFVAFANDVSESNKRKCTPITELLYKINLDINNGDYDEAIDKIEFVIGSSKYDELSFDEIVDLECQLALLYAYSDNITRALDKFEYLELRFLNNPKVYLSHGIVLYLYASRSRKAKHCEKAIDKLNSALAQNPSAPIVLSIDLFYALCLSFLGEYYKNEDYCEQAVEKYIQIEGRANGGDFHISWAKALWSYAKLSGSKESFVKAVQKLNKAIIMSIDNYYCFNDVGKIIIDYSALCNEQELESICNYVITNFPCDEMKIDCLLFVLANIVNDNRSTSSMQAIAQQLLSEEKKWATDNYNQLRIYSFIDSGKSLDLLEKYLIDNRYYDLYSIKDDFVWNRFKQNERFNKIVN